jgi:hypothetical protein
MRRKIKNFKQINLKIGECHEPQASGVIDPSEYSHYPRIEYYTFSATTMKRN